MLSERGGNRRAGGPGDRGHSRVHGSAVLQECVDVNVGERYVISAGFGELGPEGKERERKVREVLASRRLRLIGPNCVGVMKSAHGIERNICASECSSWEHRFLSQSGALCTAILDWSRRENVGFSGLFRSALC